MALEPGLRVEADLVPPSDSSELPPLHPDEIWETCVELMWAPSLDALAPLIAYRIRNPIGTDFPLALKVRALARLKEVVNMAFAMHDLKGR